MRRTSTRCSPSSSSSADCSRTSSRPSSSAAAETVRRAFGCLRDAGFDNISLDLIYGIPGQTPADLDADVADALALAPDHVSWYELEAKPGTRFAVHHGAELARQADALEEHYETVVAALRGAG